MHFEASVICAFSQPRQPPPSPSPPASAWRPPPTRTCGILNYSFWGLQRLLGMKFKLQLAMFVYWRYFLFVFWSWWRSKSRLFQCDAVSWAESSRVKLNWLHSLFMYNLQIVFPTNRTTNLTNKVQFLDPSIHLSIMIAVEGFLDDPEEARDDRGQTMRFLSGSNEYFSPFSSVYRRLHVWLLTHGEILWKYYGNVIEILD